MKYFYESPIIFLILLIFHSSPTWGDHHEAPEECKLSAVKSITSEQRKWAEDAVDEVVKNKKIPIVIMPLVISRIWSNEILSDGTHIKLKYRWIDKSLQPIANPNDLEKIWGVYIDIPISELTTSSNIFFNEIMSDILKHYKNNRSFLMIQPGWFPKTLRDSMVQSPKSVSGLLVRYLFSGDCLGSLVNKKNSSVDFITANLIQRAQNPEWAPLLAKIYWREMKRAPVNKNRKEIYWWAWWFQKVGADNPGKLISDWLDSKNANLRATAALMLGLSSYSSKMNAEKVTARIPQLKNLLNDESYQVRREALLAISRIAVKFAIPNDKLAINFTAEPIAEALVGAKFYCGTLNPQKQKLPCEYLNTKFFQYPDLSTRFLFDKIDQNRVARIWRKAKPSINKFADLVSNGEINLSPNVQRLLENHGLRIWGTPRRVAKALKKLGVSPADPLNRGYYHFALKEYDLARKAFSESGDAIKDDLNKNLEDLQSHAINAVLATGYESGVRLVAELIRNTKYERVAKKGAFSKHKQISKAANDWARKRSLRWTVVEVPGVGIPGVSSPKKK